MKSPTTIAMWIKGLLNLRCLGQARYRGSGLHFDYFIIYCVNGCFWGTALSGLFNVWTTCFILILH